MADALLENLTPEEPFTQTKAREQRSGRVTLYDTITGVPSHVLEYLVNGTLRKKRADGTRVFTLMAPKEPPKVGTIKCLLHPNAPDRARFAAMGWEACPRTQIPNQFQLEQHMQSKHRREWAALKREEEQRDKDEQRNYQRGILELIRDRTGGEFNEICLDCGETFSSKVKAAAGNMLAAHVRRNHPPKE